MPFLESKAYSKLIFIVIMALFLFLAFSIVRPFLIVVISSAVLAYLFYPIYTRVNSRIKKPGLSSLLMILVLILLVMVPAYYIAQSLYLETRTIIQGHPYSSFLQSLSPETSSLFSEGMKKIVVYFAERTSEFIFSLPQLILSLFIFIFSLYYFFKDGPKIVDDIESLLPFRENERNFFHREFKAVTSGVIYGLLLTSLIEGVLGGLGFYLFGISSPIMWGLIMFVLAVIPGLGTPIVWLPAGIIKIIQGNLFAGLGIMAYGIIMVVLIEFLLRPKLIKDKSKIHPLTILLGVIGGLKLLGFVGIIIGPLILGLLVPFIEGFILKRKKLK